MDYQAVKQGAYNNTYNAIVQKMGVGYLPNIKAIRKEIRSIKGRMELIEKHAEFAQGIEEAERANNRLAMLGGECEAYTDILKYINDRIREAEKQRSK